MPDADYWMPICFTSISEEGFLNLYYRNISPGLGIMLLSTNPDNIGEAVQMCQKIEIVDFAHCRVFSKKRSPKRSSSTPRCFRWIRVDCCVTREAFGFDNVERIIVLSVAKSQYFIWGSPIYAKLDRDQRK